MKAVAHLDSVAFKREVLDSLKLVASITAQTLGPGGRSILLEQDNGTVLATKDGVSVAKHFAKNKAANSSIGNLVVQAAVESSDRTGRSCGDGTTSSLVLASAIVEAGQDWIQKNPGYSPQRLARELKETYQTFIIPEIEKLARPIKNLNPDEAEKAIWHVAAVSANFDTDIADAVTEASLQAGENGFVIVEEGAGGNTTSVSYQSGFPVVSGLSDLGGSAAAAFVNRKAYGDSVLNGAYVALYDGEINDIETVRPLLERVMNETDENGMNIRSPIVIVAHGFGDMVLKALAQQFRTGALSVVPLVTPRNGQALGRQGFLHDLNSFTGGLVFDPTSDPLTNATPASIGFSEEVKIGASQTVFMTEPDQDEIQKRMDDLKKQMDDASEWDKDRLRYRIGSLTGGVATIYAGGATSLEAKERRDRVVDAVSAVRSAMEMGVVPGGGSTLLHISRQLPQVSYNSIFEQALKRPFVQILLNAGAASNEQEALFIGNNVGMTKTGDFQVYDALKHTTVEFWDSGIFDGAKTVSHALQNALSVAQLLMTTGGAIAIQVSNEEESIKSMQRGILQAMNGETE
jgi:chaperonin GroEL